jgi:hypothetical protein
MKTQYAQQLHTGYTSIPPIVESRREEISTSAFDNLK